jgi:hypothetical protein
MARWLGWALLLLGTTAHADDESLNEVLQRIGEQLRRAQTPQCSYTERTTVEELGGDREVKAREVPTARVSTRQGEVRRTFLPAVRERGQLDERLRPKRDDEISGRERAQRMRTPFHLEEQSKYRFAWTPSRDGISFEPRQPALERGVGVGHLRDGALHRIVSRPSSYPVFLRELNLRTELTETACGLQPTRFEFTGEGGLLFVRKRFHSLTVSEGHSVVARADN